MLEAFARKVINFSCAHFAPVLEQTAKTAEELASVRSVLKITSMERDDAAFRVKQLVLGVDQACKEVCRTT
jgi:hypothetical protein